LQQYPIPSVYSYPQQRSQVHPFGLPGRGIGIRITRVAYWSVELLNPVHPSGLPYCHKVVKLTLAIAKYPDNRYFQQSPYSSLGNLPYSSLSKFTNWAYPARPWDIDVIITLGFISSITTISS